MNIHIFFLILTSQIIYNLPITSSQLTDLRPSSGNQGQWHLLHSSVGISAMHMQLLRTNKVIMFDRTDYGPSNISLPRGQCRRDPNDTVLKVDCTAHSILYDLGSNTFRPLTVHTDTWCSSGSVLPDGTLVQTGGYNDGDRVVRTFSPCNNDNCDWLELPKYLIQRRWYATNQILPDGRVIIVGGRRQFNYEFYPRSSQNQGGPHTIWLEFLRQTTDQDENNLYPFLHLLPDGNLFIFANAKSIIFDYSQNAVVRELPDIPGGDPRNYPSTGSSVLLPLDENTPSNGNMEVEIMVCGGTPRNSHVLALHGEFISALGTCGRLNVYDPSPRWVVEFMPVPRVMADMLLLPTGDVVIINGAALGAAGWENGRDPVTTPVIYRPSEVLNRRFSVMTGSSRARLYHSAAVLVPDGRILVGGSNPHIYYNFTGVEYPTDLSLEAFSPPYLSEEYDPVRPRIAAIEDVFGYRQLISVEILVPEFLSVRVLSARLVAPSFTTHSFAMNQRMVVLKLIGVTHVAAGTYRVSLVGPSTAEIAPPGYYLLFVVHADIPSSAAWVRVQ
ncbi:aldehyde oxidase GLOX [Malus sylvestris]|uniref:aldehyde oxidase GLOX n=1 Tax=Malus sylvestris TaxID=3752 RepID=UPI0021ABDA2C|nr:aldehyde oxidase GLOX [Malus sylvestris]